MKSDFWSFQRLYQEQLSSANLYSCWTLKVSLWQGIVTMDGRVDGHRHLSQNFLVLDWLGFASFWQFLVLAEKRQLFSRQVGLYVLGLWWFY